MEDTKLWVDAAFTLAGSIGGGAAVFFAAMRWWLRDDFATTDDFKNTNRRIEDVASDIDACTQRLTLLDELTRRQDMLDVRQAHQWERIAENVIQPLQKMANQLEAMGKRQERHDSMLAQMLSHQQRQDQRLDAMRDGP